MTSFAPDDALYCYADPAEYAASFRRRLLNLHNRAALRERVDTAISEAYAASVESDLLARLVQVTSAFQANHLQKQIRRN